MKIAPGQKVAIVGRSGSGKSTLVRLFARFYDVTEGNITIDGFNIKNLNLSNLRRLVGFVLQESFLFNGTIRENISLGDPAETLEKVIEAAKLANAHDFISDLALGYETKVGESGLQLSGGQKQRLSIARAIAKSPEIYIFDDSFSALDFKTDATLRKALKEHTSDSTVLIVAQRISTILHADQIIVLDEGKIVGMGTHKELMKNCEVYKQIASSQLSKEELEHE